MRLYIIRHADPDYQNDSITPAGHLEAKALARRLAACELTHLYVSSMGRAQVTARYTATLTDLEPVILPWVRELQGLDLPLEDPEYENGRLNVWDLPGEFVREGPTAPDHDSWHRIALFDDPNIRATYDDIISASDRFLARHGFQREGLRYRITRPNQDQIAVFCHNGIGLTWLAHLLALPLPLAWVGFWLPTSSVTTILFEARDDVWAVPRALGVGDVSHLYAAGLPVLPRGIKGGFH
jgi:broad specificity phosphatase PhoE